jgi:hypothetical protein
MLAIVNGSFGLGIMVGLLIVGVPNAMLWGLLAAVLRFIPYIGPWLAAAFPVLYTLAVFPDWTHPIGAAGVFVVCELISNNIVEPWLYGSSTGISNVAVIASAVFWTWLWGPIGLILATPMTVCLAVMGKYVPQIEWLSILLGDEPVLSLPARVYQRLLAGDEEEASDLVDEAIGDRPVVEIFDEALLPALSMAERDRHRGKLDEDRRRYIRDSMKGMIEELAERARVARKDAALPKPELSVVCLPAFDEADELAGLMLTSLLQAEGVSVASLSASELASEMMDKVVEHKADVACVVAMPPSAVVHTRYLCKRLRSQHPELKVLIMLWQPTYDLVRLKQKLQCGPDDAVTQSLKEAVHWITTHAHPLMSKAT